MYTKKIVWAIGRAKYCNLIVLVFFLQMFNVYEISNKMLLNVTTALLLCD